MNYCYSLDVNAYAQHLHEKSSLIFRYFCFLLCMGTMPIFAQNQVEGSLKDAESDAAIIGARIIVVGAAAGALSDAEGNFSFKSPQAPPFSLQITYFGFDTLVLEVTDLSKPLKLSMNQREVVLGEVEITATALSERQQQSALTVENMSITAIKETPAANFYEGLGHLKGVDLNSASFGFKVVNTRGFNSTQPVRSLQLIDGVDNQSPGLNFSLGNFLGASELDLESVDLVVGASSAFYGPNAFNGVIAMTTKDPFVHRGLSISVKGGERNWLESAIRYAHVFKNKKGDEKLAIKLNAFYLRADDWEADNFEEAYRDVTEIGAFDFVGTDNPGGYDAVNRYGDEVFGIADELGGDLYQRPGLGKYYRSGYEEKDLVDYNTRNVKLGGAIHYKLWPEVDLIAGSNYSYGTTVFQGVNRISFKDIQFFQHKLEVRKKGKFFVRAYMTHEDAGNSYDPVFTALRLQGLAVNDLAWRQGYQRNWENNYVSQTRNLEGYPAQMIPFDFDQQAIVLDANRGQLTEWHQSVRAVVDRNFLVPGTPQFQAAFDSITSRIITTEGGTRFFSKSALYHGHGEYKFTPGFGEITVGANARYYTPKTNGSIFADGGDENVTNFEFGLYAGIKKKAVSDRLTVTASLRLDKNVNFGALLSPAVTAAFKLNEQNTLRASISYAIRNPTLADQFLFYDVGGATLVGNIEGYTNLIDIDSLRVFLTERNPNTIENGRIDIPRIEPEKVASAEIGYRGMLGNRLYVDGSYYFSRYQDFIGFRFGFAGDLQFGFPVGKLYRVSANATDVVTTQGVSVGLNYFLNDGYSFGGNYSWNILNTNTDDPIVPAYNTPEHKFNVNFSGRDITLFGVKKLGFNVNYKWVQGFLFEGSPQFTGLIPTYQLLDAQVNKVFPKINATVKIGASNILNNKVFTVYGGPRIGRLAYTSITFDFPKL